MHFTRSFRFVLALAACLRPGASLPMSSVFDFTTQSAPLTRSNFAQYGGNCARYAGAIDDLYTEAITLAQNAVNSLNNYGSNPTVQATLESYFGIGRNGGAPADQGSFSYVKSALMLFSAFLTSQAQEDKDRGCHIQPRSY